MAGQLRIVCVYQTHPFEEGQGGGVRYVRNLLEEQRGRCAEVLFLGVGPSKSEEPGVRFVPLTRRLTGYLPFLFKLGLKLLSTNLSSYDLVHVHRLYFAIPFLILKPRLPVVCTLHGRTFAVFGQRFGSGPLGLVAPLFRCIERFALKRIQRLVPVSQDVVRSFDAKYPELMEARRGETQVIGSMLNLEAFQVGPSDYLQVRHGAANKYLLFLGRLAPVKDVGFLLQLFAQHFQDPPHFEDQGELKLVLVGSGEEDQHWQQEAERLCPKNRPLFLGALPADQVPALLQSADLLVLCSEHEASPTIIKEALACGLPVVSNATGDVEEFLINGQNGYLVPKELESFAEAIESLLAHPLEPSEVRRVSEERLATCSRAHVGARYQALYEELVGVSSSEPAGSEAR